MLALIKVKETVQIVKYLNMEKFKSCAISWEKTQCLCIVTHFSPKALLPSRYTLITKWIKLEPHWVEAPSVSQGIICLDRSGGLEVTLRQPKHVEVGILF